MQSNASPLFRQLRSAFLPSAVKERDALSKENEQLKRQIEQHQNEMENMMKQLEQELQASSARLSSVAVKLFQKVNPLITEERKQDNHEMTATVVSGVISAVKQQLECLICMELMQGQVFNCRKGHPLCSGCLLKLNPKECPKCKAPVTRESRCFPLEAIAEEWAFPCRNIGCKQLIQLKRRQQHEDECGYTVFKCFLGDSYSGNRSQLEEHARKHHAVHTVAKTKTSIVAFCAYYILYENELFVLKAGNKGHDRNGVTNVNIAVFHLGPTSKTRKYSATFKLFSQDASNRVISYDILPENGRTGSEGPAISVPSASWLKEKKYLVNNKFKMTFTINDRHK